MFSAAVQGVMQAGDLVSYTEPPPPFDDYAFTVRLYDDDNGVLFAADEVRDADLAMPADSDAEEFYLLTTATDSGFVWTTTTIASRGVFGYIAPDCGDNDLSDDGSMCVVERETTENEMPENQTPAASARPESKVREHAWTAFGGALAIGVLSYLLSDGTLNRLFGNARFWLFHNRKRLCRECGRTGGFS